MKAAQTGSALICALLLSGGALAAGQEHEHGGPPHQPGPASHVERPPGEPHSGPRGYARVTEPHGWNNRPATVDRGAYQHNFQAARTFHIGAYRRPAGWAPHHWVYGQILPRAYWGANYLIADYWLFALEVPPAGYEWVRDDTDALLINVQTGEILQVEYGVFA
ncbi:MAG TPA: RcnB family protein [Steroidobacteraceae bacterium]|nr:RcnB family protein [Steroidobacteraceae bacterium]